MNIDEVLAGLEGDVLSFEDESSYDQIAALPVELESAPVDDFQLSELLDTPAKLTDIPEIESVKPSLSEIAADNLGLDADDDILAFLDDDIPLVSDESDVIPELETATVESFASDIVPEVMPEAVATADDIEMDSLLDEILMTPEDSVEDFVPKYDEEPAVDAAELLAQEEQSDLDLVKSLMADLADDPSGFETADEIEASTDFDATDEFEVETDEDLESLLAIPEVEDIAPVEVVETPEVATELATETPEDVAVEAEEDILGDILDMTLEDELQAQPDDIAVEDMVSMDDVLAAEQENILENTDDFEAAEAETETPLSLSDIAAAAEADAVAVETSASPAPVATAIGATVAAGAGLTALAAVTAKADTQTTEIETITAQSVEIETVTVETIIETPTQSLPSQETPMPVKAVQTDTILDDVTESATAGAFAELNQVVEDKAIFNERGPRIGDLVQEALRPMLKEWLDANLKGIVERAVTKEVKRISSGK